jgi:hypothetical protein
MPHQSMSRYSHLLVLIVVLGGALSAPAQQWIQLPPTPDFPKPERSGMAAVNGIRLWYSVFWLRLISFWSKLATSLQRN